MEIQILKNGDDYIELLKKRDKINSELDNFIFLDCFGHQHLASAFLKSHPEILDSKHHPVQ